MEVSMLDFADRVEPAPAIAWNRRPWSVECARASI